ncbi:MAG: hypothetical protein Q4C12_07635 [Clostridia bacterium]|nr:hypothetical protein [Clostridia bacterium]
MSKWKSNSANASILAVSVCLGMVFIMCAIFEYMQMLIITTGIRNAVESAVVSAVNANYDEAYSQLREGYSGSYLYADDGFRESIDTWNIYTRLDELLALTETGGKHIKYKADSVIEYSISNLRLDFENAGLAQGNSIKNLNATAYVDVEIPVRYGGRELVPIRYTMRIKASYIPKF